LNGLTIYSYVRRAVVVRSAVTGPDFGLMCQYIEVPCSIP